MDNIESGITPSNFDLDGCTVVITGGAGLLGQTFAREIALQGGKPIIADIRIEAAELAAEKINFELGSEIVWAVGMDITSKTSIQKAIHDILSRFGKIDALVNNAYPKNKN